MVHSGCAAHRAGPGTPFIFEEPLGQAREVKVALSGLFGRFVARACLKRYLNLSSSRTSRADRCSLMVGAASTSSAAPVAIFLTGWTSAADLTSLTVAEAKGCRDPGGPNKALARGWTQAQRIDVTARGRKVTIKRVAIATRWGAVPNGPAQAYLSVRDPVDEGAAITPGDKDAVFIGLLRHRITNLIDPLGHAELVGALRRLAREHLQRGLQRDFASARILLNAAAHTGSGRDERHRWARGWNRHPSRTADRRNSRAMPIRMCLPA